jgi:predicted nucleic acid-binding protein
LIDSDDVNHRAATKSFGSLAQTEALFTHSYVCLETATLVQRRMGMSALRALVDDVLPVLEIEWVDEMLHRAAETALLAAGRRSVSFVDWTSFEIMRRRRVIRALAFDDDFVTQGFELVR